MPKVLIVDPLADDARQLGWMLANAPEERFTVEVAAALPADPAGLRLDGTELLLLGLAGEADLATLGRLREARPELPVVVLDHGEEPTLGRRALRLGAQDHLIKSRLDPATLCRSLLNALERSRAAAAPAAPPRELVQTMTGILDRLPLGVLFLDRRRRVMFLNQRAQELLAEAEVAGGEAGGELRLIDGGEQRRFQQITAAVLAGGGEAEAGHAMAVSRRGAGQPLSLLITAVGHDRPGAVLFLSDPASPVAISTEILTALYGLTPAEGRLVAELARGHALEAIAAALHVSPHTLRTQLKQVFRKTGTSRQPELIKLILTGPAVIGGTAG